MITVQFSTGFQLSAEEWDDFFAEEGEDGKLVWTNAILDELIHRLEELSGSAGLWDTTPYADEADGTLNLWLDLLEDGRSIEYAIGVVVFHQLLYQTPLTATKLTG